MKKLFVAVILMLVAIPALSQQGDAPAQQDQQAQSQGQQQRQPASPRGKATFQFENGKSITVDYGRPYMRGRKIMGELVPYGKVWRTGANAATSFVTDTGLVLGGKDVPAGKYTIFTIPGEQEWTIIINKQTGQWGTQYDETQDLARFTTKAAQLKQPVDQFTISFDKKGSNAGVMKLEWENTSVAVDLAQKTQ